MDAARTGRRSVRLRRDRSGTSSSATGGTRPAWLLVAALLVPVVAALAVWWWQDQERDEIEAARAEDRAAVNAATELAHAWASVDYREVDTYIETVQEGATGDFRDKFDQFVSVTRRLVVSNKQVQEPDIPKDGAALIERSGDQARVLVVLDAVMTTKASPDPVYKAERLLVELTKVDGQWLVSSLEPIDAAL